MTIPFSQKRKIRMLLWGAITGVSAILAYPTVRLLGKRRPRFVYATATLSEKNYILLASKPGWSSVLTPVSDGISLRGLVRRPANLSAPWVLFFPGNDLTQLATAQEFLERLRQQRDWGLFVSSYRGYDSSGGTPSRDSLVTDASQVYTSLLEREKLAPSQMNVVAFSLGGYLAVHVAGQVGQPGRSPATVSLLACVESIEMVRPSLFQRFAPGDVYDTQPLLDAIATPVLVLMGTNDEALGVQQGRVIAKRLGVRAHYVELPGVGHAAILASEPSLSAIRAWIESPVTPT